MSVFTYPTFWWWLVPILATHLGGVLGAWTYYLAIELHWTKKDDMEAEDEEEEAEPLPIKRDLEKNGHQKDFVKILFVCSCMAVNSGFDKHL